MEQEAAKIYRVVESAAEGDGERLTDFSFPWLDRQPPRTEFRARWTAADRRLHFAFDVADDDIVLGEGADAKQQVIGSDRVEIFFAVDERLSRYFCFEMDPRGVVLDYAAQYHRRMDWDWSIGDLVLDTEMRHDGYSVAGSVALDELAELGCVQSDAQGRSYLIAGVYRAEFHRDSAGNTVEDWIAWVDPRTATPDFHVPASFGRFLLTE